MNLEKDSRQAFNMKRSTSNVQIDGEKADTTASGARGLQVGGGRGQDRAHRARLQERKTAGRTATERRCYRGKDCGRARHGRAAARPYQGPSPKLWRAFWGQRPPLYVSAKRTHRFFERFFAYHQHCQELMSFAESVCRWVRFGKRTHREGVFEGSLQESGYVLRITDEHGRRHGRSRTCRERMSVPLYKGSLLGPEKTWKRGRAFAIMGTSREAARLWPLGVFNNSWKTRPKYL
jgi:hypothetical protein